MKKITSLIMACLLVLSLCACSSEPALAGTMQVDNQTTAETTTVAGNETFKLGDSVELYDVVVSFIGIEESSGSDFNEPTDGNVFILCEFEIANNSQEEINVSSMLSFEAYCDDYACEYSFSALMAKADKDQLDGTVAAGKKMKGVVGYEVPTYWKELEIQFTPDILSNDRIVFVATND